MDDEPLGALRPGPASRGEPGRTRVARLDPSRHDRPYGPREVDDRPYGPDYYRHPAPHRGGLKFSYIVLGLTVALALAFAAAPLWAFRSLRSAAVYGDSAALSELVDYGAVRASLRPQLGPTPAAAQPPPPDFLHDPLGALRRQFQPVAKPVEVDAYLTPSALGRMSLGMGKDGPAPTLKGEGPLPSIRFWDGKRVRLGVSDPANAGRETIFTLQRKGWFAWRLVALTLPA